MKAAGGAVKSSKSNIQVARVEMTPSLWIGDGAAIPTTVGNNLRGTVPVQEQFCKIFTLRKQ